MAFGPAGWSCDGARSRRSHTRTGSSRRCARCIPSTSGPVLKIAPPGTSGDLLDGDLVAEPFEAFDELALGVGGVAAGPIGGGAGLVGGLLGVGGNSDVGG